VDTDNLAPSLGIAWRPNVTNKLGRMILGDPEQAVITAGYTRAFNRERVDRFTNVYANNPGVTTPANRNTAATGFCLVCPGESWPILLRETSRLGPPAFQKSPVLPITAATNQNINIFDPDIKTPYTDSWSLALQRSLGKSTAVEVRYIGNYNHAPWRTENWNDTDFIENGFLSEFKLAQANLLANVAAGRGATFAYFGDGTGTSPLPIFLSSFTALPASAATNPTNYTIAAFANSTQFTNTTWVNALDNMFPDPQGIASNLNTSNSALWRNNLLASGQPINFWVMNPLVNQAIITQNQGGSKYHSLQIDVRRRLSQGLAVQGSYTYARANALSVFDFRLPLIERRNVPNNPGGVPHAVKVLWTYDIPVGRGKRFGTDMNKWLDGVVGGWQFAGAGRVQQPIFRLGTNVKIVGMTFEEAQDAFSQIRINVDPLTGAVTVWDMPQDIYDNTRLAYSRTPTTVSGYFPGLEPQGRYFAPAAGADCQGGALGYPSIPGDCAPDYIFHGKWYAEFDFTFQKRFPLGSKATFDFRFEVFNAFMAKNFNQTLNPGSGSNIFRITGTGSGARIGQMIWRINF